MIYSEWIGRGIQVEFDISQIKKAIEKSVPLKFSSYTLSHETLEKLDKILEFFLEELGEERIKNQLSYCMRELAENGRKANLKRIYFIEKNFNINNYNDYLTGMKTFKTDVYGNLPDYIEKLKEKKLYTKISFLANSSFLTLSVSNNVPIMGYELKRIEERISHSRAFKTMEEAFSSVLDQTEGAGLGIVILILMLKKIGLSEDAFQIKKDGDETEAKIIIPRSDVLLENLDPLVKKIIADIKVLPQFPEHISSLQKLLANPDTDFSQIAQVVKTDPALTGDLLKLVNSAQYMLRNKIQDIEEALKMVGFRGMRNLLYSYGSQKLLKDKYGEMKRLWEHSYRTAFYGYHIAKNYNFKKIHDDVYVSSLLHDLGQVIVEFLHPDLLENIKTFTVDRGITAEMFEKFTIGLHHAEIGARIAEHWHFPDQLIAAIRFHHEPEKITGEMKELVYTVYLANSLCNIEEGNLLFEQMNPLVLSFFNLKKRESLETLHNGLKQTFESELVE
ncbi:MAG: HDOD domain-containing protein [Spirochaetales bacterium]|nr:HDOD domain-containing protein [Spirochaetales bacterium]